VLRNAAARTRVRLQATTPSRTAGVVAAALILLWSFTLSDVRLSILVGVIGAAIAALGLDVLVARTGQLSLAHGAFLGVGAFTALNIGGRGGAWPIAVLGAVGATGLAATLVGLPSLRIRGLQIAITTLAFQVMAENFLFVRQDFTAAGKTLQRPGFLTSDVRLYLFALATLAGVLVVRRRLAVTRAGRAFLAVRDVEARAQCFGIEPGATKLLAYAISGCIVGLGGALLAIKEGSISAKDPFVLLESLQLVAIVVVGGAGSAPGIIAASVLVKGLPQFISKISFFGIHVSATRWVPILSSALLVVAVVRQPEGIGGVLRALGRTIDKRLRPSTGDELPPRPQATDPVAAAHNAAALRDVPRPLALRMPVPALLVAEDVTVRYGGVTALSNVSLEIRRGEVVGLIGANGAGKSTFFNAVSGLAPVTGSIRYRGVELFERAPSGRSALGAARTFQDMGLVRAETVKENLLLAQTWLSGYGPVAGILGLGATLWRERDLRRRADLALALFGLEHLADERLGDLPYGTMRTVEIASAVAAGPDLLMLDEASAGLGPEEAHALGDRFLALRDELQLTLVVIEHHVPLIARVCDYAYCLESGALIAEGPPDHVTSQPQVIESFLGRGGAAGRSAKKASRSTKKAAASV
jgi:ABC-type branched-subunit amino acid transport system ATPase component/ABC-type branched-subunit amino acid transport system permease subunit